MSAALLLLLAGDVTGLVIDASTSNPISDASVVLFPGPTAPSRPPFTGRTNGAGTYEFTNVDPGRYMLEIRKPGYATLHRHPGFGLFAEVPSSGTVNVTTVRLQRSGSMEGRVATSAGAPISGAVVKVFGVEDVQAATQTDGRYRLTDLPPGEWQVHALIPEELRQRAGLPALVYHPGQETSDKALKLRLEGGQHLTGIDIRVEPTRLVELSGRVRNADNDQPVAGKVHLRPTDQNRWPETRYNVPLEDGAFRFMGVRPGTYRLIIRKPSTSVFVETVQVGPQGLSGHSITFPNGTRLAGKIAGTLDLGGARLSIRATPPNSFEGAEARVGSDGTFVFEDLVPGTWMITHSLGTIGGASLPRLSFPSVSQGGRPLARNEVEVRPGPNVPIELRFAAQTKVSGIVVDANGHPAARAAVLIWRESQLRMIGYTKADGTFDLDVESGDIQVSTSAGGNTPPKAPCNPVNVHVAERDVTGLRVTACPAGKP